MVGPVSDEERESVTRKVKLAFTTLIALSAGLVSLQGNPSPLVVLAAIGGGFVVGGLLIWYVFPESTTVKRERREF